jgi:hypothetical protein
MRIVNIIPKDICVQIELPISELKKINEALDHASINLPDSSSDSFTVLTDFNTMLYAVIKDLAHADK